MVIIEESELKREQRNIKRLGSYGKHGRASCHPGQMNNALTLMNYMTCGPNP